MIDFDRALDIVVHAATPLGSEKVPLFQAASRYLAGQVIARVDSPPSDVSAMDGYAVRDGDQPPFKLVGSSYPGAGYSERVGQSESVRIFTGAPVPCGADRVIVQEIVRLNDGLLYPEGSPSQARHVRIRGSDFLTGDVLLPVGRFLDPRALVAAAGADLPSVEVWSKPRVAVLGTGDELIDPGRSKDTPGTIPESVSFGVSALIESFGGSCVRRERQPDQPEQLRDAAESALADADLVVITGGASVGEKDYAKSVFADLGVELLFSKVSIKPGKPVWFGRVCGRLIMGLPGNPTSALVTGRLLLAPLVLGMAGGRPNDALRWRKATAGSDIDACGDRETFLRGRWEDDIVQPLLNQDSGAQRALAEADLLIRRRANAPAAPSGSVVEIIDF